MKTVLIKTGIAANPYSIRAATVPVGTPASVAFTPDGTKVCVITADNPPIFSVINTALNQVTSTVKLDSHPCGMAIWGPTSTSLPQLGSGVLNADFTEKYITTAALKNSGKYQVAFTDTSTTGEFIDPIVSWDWDFGDNSPHSHFNNPTHIYKLNTYNVVKLTIKTRSGAILIANSVIAYVEDTSRGGGGGGSGDESGNNNHNVLPQ
jgi:YVTN family beta-propeller protein